MEFRNLQAGRTTTLKAKILSMVPSKAPLRLPVFLSLFLFLYTAPSLNANTGIVTSDDLNNAITNVNTGGVPAILQFNTNSLDLSTLSSTLGTLGFATTWQDLTGNNYLTFTKPILGAQAGLVSTALIEFSSSYAITVTGAGTWGADGSGNGLTGNTSFLNAGSLQLDNNSQLTLNGGAGNDAIGTGAGGTGGDTNLTVTGGVSMTASSIQLNAGIGGNANDVAGGNGGPGGGSERSV